MRRGEQPPLADDRPVAQRLHECIAALDARLLIISNNIAIDFLGRHANRRRPCSVHRHLAAATRAAAGAEATAEQIRRWAGRDTCNGARIISTAVAIAFDSAKGC